MFRVRTALDRNAQYRFRLLDGDVQVPPMIGHHVRIVRMAVRLGTVAAGPAAAACAAAHRTGAASARRVAASAAKRSAVGAAIRLIGQTLHGLHGRDTKVTQE